MYGYGHEIVLATVKYWIPPYLGTLRIFINLLREKKISENFLDSISVCESANFIYLF